MIDFFKHNFLFKEFLMVKRMKNTQAYSWARKKIMYKYPSTQIDDKKKQIASQYTFQLINYYRIHYKPVQLYFNH